MPTYEYRCDACSHEFEEFQSITAPVKRKCPKCGKSKLQRLIGTGAGILFKGGGFYETDYRSENYKKAAEADKKAAEPAAESKPDSKTKSEPGAAAKPDAAAQPSSTAEPKPNKKSAKRSDSKRMR